MMGSEASKAALPGPEPMENYVGRIEAVLKQMIRAGGFALEVSVSKAAADPGGSIDPEAPEWVVNLSGRDSGIALESHAELLDALASVACKAARLDESLHRRIAFDCEGYRQARALELRLMAQMAADRVVEYGEPFEMSSMNSAERRLVHLALKEKPQVRSESEGTGPGRRVVIRLALPQKAK